MEQLNKQLWAIAKEYARQFGEVIGVEPEYWVGVDDEGNGTIDICCFGDTLFFSFEEMQEVIDNLPKWVERYGSREAVGDEVRLWVDWWLDDAEQRGYTQPEFAQARTTPTFTPQINLRSWLMGCPRERQPESPHQRLHRLKATRELLRELIDQYRSQRSLWNVFDSLTTDIQRTQAEVEKLDKQFYEDMKQTEAYHDFEQTVKEHTDGQNF